MKLRLDNSDSAVAGELLADWSSHMDYTAVIRVLTQERTRFYLALLRA
jgi:hypothetical protein